MSVRIVLADDHRLFREGMRSMLSAHPNFEVVGEAEDGATAIQLATDLFPDLVLMDVGLPVVKKEAFQDLTKALEMAMDGKIYLSPVLDGVTSVEYNPVDQCLSG